MTVTGGSGPPGLAALKAVEEEPNNGTGSVTLLPLLMGGKLVRGNLQTPQLATQIIVSSAAKYNRGVKYT